MIGLIVTIYINRLQKDIYPSECAETFYINEVDYAYRFENPQTVLQENIAKNDLRFVCFLGIAYHFPGVDLKEDQSIIKKYGSKLICTGDLTDERHTLFIEKLYAYYAQYNAMLLEKLQGKKE